MNRSLILPLLGLALAGQAAAQMAPRVGDDPVGSQDGASAGDSLDALDDAQLDVRTLDGIESVKERPDGGVRRVKGAIPTAGTDPVTRAGDFMRRYGDIFGADPGVDLEAQPRGKLSPRRLRLSQRVRGHMLVGHGMSLLFDDRGAVREAHGVLAPNMGSAPSPVIDVDDARQRALAAVGLDRADVVADPDVESLARLEAGGLRLLQRVKLVRDDHLPLAIDIDALDGTVLRIAEDGVHGTAIFKYGGEDVELPTGAGKGAVYRSIKGAQAASELFGGLKNLVSADVGPFQFAGTLTGRYSQVVDASGLQIYNAESEFAFADDGGAVFGSYPNQIVEYQVFDHVNTYCWLDRMGTWFSKTLGDFDGDYTVLAYVNFDDGGAGYVNALYSPADPDGAGGYAPGYFLFGEFSDLSGDPMDDLSRDPSIVCHEYTHMVVDKSGGSFGDDALDTPPRAVNEALADYAAASSLKDAMVGRAFMTHAADDLALDGDAFRDLEAEITLVDDLWREVGYSTGLPEEHIAGEIFGAALWSVRKAVKPKKADAAIFSGLLGWPMSSAEVGYGVVDEGNAEACYAAYYFACAETLVEDLLGDGEKPGQRDAGRALGAFMKHGIVGVSPATTISFDASEGLAFAFESAFLGSIDRHTIELELGVGQQVTVVMKGVGGTTVDFDLGDEPGELDHPKGKKTDLAGTKAAESGMVVLGAKTFTLTLSDPSGAGGRYRLLVKVK